MNTANEKPAWAPDDCPPDVVTLIDADDTLNKLGLRGLASANAKQLRNAVLRLESELAAAYGRGRRNGFGKGLVVGLAWGALLGWTVAAFG